MFQINHVQLIPQKIRYIFPKLLYYIIKLQWNKQKINWLLTPERLYDDEQLIDGLKVTFKNVNIFRGKNKKNFFIVALSIEVKYVKTTKINKDDNIRK